MYHLLKHNLVLNWANMFFICRSSNDIFWYVIINRELYIYLYARLSILYITTYTSTAIRL